MLTHETTISRPFKTGLSACSISSRNSPFFLFSSPGSCFSTKLIKDSARFFSFSILRPRMTNSLNASTLFKSPISALFILCILPKKIEAQSMCRQQVTILSFKRQIDSRFRIKNLVQILYKKIPSLLRAERCNITLKVTCYSSSVKSCHNLFFRNRHSCHLSFRRFITGCVNCTCRSKQQTRTECHAQNKHNRRIDDMLFFAQAILKQNRSFRPDRLQYIPLAAEEGLTIPPLARL